jgi:hypothetical protein
MMHYNAVPKRDLAHTTNFNQGLLWLKIYLFVKTKCFYLTVKRINHNIKGKIQNINYFWSCWNMAMMVGGHL